MRERKRNNILAQFKTNHSFIPFVRNVKFFPFHQTNKFHNSILNNWETFPWTRRIQREKREFFPRENGTVPERYVVYERFGLFCQIEPRWQPGELGLFVCFALLVCFSFEKQKQTEKYWKTSNIKTRSLKKKLESLWNFLASRKQLQILMKKFCFLVFPFFKLKFNSLQSFNVPLCKMLIFVWNLRKNSGKFLQKPPQN